MCNIKKKKKTVPGEYPFIIVIFVILTVTRASIKIITEIDCVVRRH